MELEARSAGEPGTAWRKAWEVRPPASVEVELCGDGPWTLAVRADAAWAAERTAKEEDRQVRMHVFATGEVKGVVESEDAAAPAAVRASFAASPSVHQRARNEAERAALEALEGETTCPIAGEVMRCKLPRAVLDLRLAADGFIPHYRWDVEVVESPAKDLGVLRLQRGSSVAGFVVVGEGEGGGEGARVRLEPAVLGWAGDPRSRKRIAGRAMEATANSRGFFQVSAVAPGAYHLVVDKEGFIEQRLEGVRVGERQETFLEHPIALHPPRAIEAFLTPPVDPYGRPWTIALRKPIPGSIESRTIVESEADLSGSWRAGGLADGEYVIEIEDHRDSTWQRQELTVASPLESLFVDVPVVEIEGEIRFGDEPLAATMAWGGAFRSPSILITSDEKGKFEGYLPDYGVWQVDLVSEGDESIQSAGSVEVKPQPGRRRAKVEIRLPDTEISGEVVRGNGEPVAAAGVLLIREGERRARGANLLTDEKGEFRLRGLAEGEYLLRAYEGERTSEWSAIHLVDGMDASHLRLVLDAVVELEGQVVSAAGEVPGSQVIAITWVGDPSLATVKTATGGADGTFRLSVPASSRAADLVVVPPGLAMQFLHVAINAERPAPLLVYAELNGGTVSLGADDPQELLAAFLVHGSSAVNVKTLFQILSASGRMKFAAAGGLEVVAARPGEYALCRSVVRPADGCASGVLAPGGALTLRLPARSGSGDAAGAE
ncbi:MAG: carboxypeptidase regulatory-like domain-containing protein [Acidobacteria bacterium]|nr:MAG: carboxypeptidase regulatory-like domain-containing protein [Acidobacteriota bacterium]